MLIDMIAAVDPTLTVRDGHDIAQSISHELIHEFEFKTEVLVHIDPCDAPDAHEPTAHHRQI